MAAVDLSNVEIRVSAGYANFNNDIAKYLVRLIGDFDDFRRN